MHELLNLKLFKTHLQKLKRFTLTLLVQHIQAFFKPHGQNTPEDNSKHTGPYPKQNIKLSQPLDGKIITYFISKSHNNASTIRQ